MKIRIVEEDVYPSYFEHEHGLEVEVPEALATEFKRIMAEYEAIQEKIQRAYKQAEESRQRR